MFDLTQRLRRDFNWPAGRSGVILSGSRFNSLGAWLRYDSSDIFSLNLGMLMRVDLVLELEVGEKMEARSGGLPD